MPSDTFQPRACKCLNVRISPTTTPPDATPPHTISDSCYAPVYVNDDGIAVAHTQVTVRLVSKAEPVSGTAKHSRYTTLTCLFCDLAVYRVYHEVSLDVEGNDAPLFPSENWVEHEVMKSPNGWVEVHKDCIVGDKISEAESSSSYASTFSLVLPPPVSPLSTPLELSQEDEDDILPKKQPSDEPAREYLPNLRPLFLPPPFTPSHPVFHHISGIAGNESQTLRAEAEQRIADFAKAQEAELEEKEKKLKENVEVLWKNFKRNLDRAQGERGRITSQSRARPPTHAVNGVSSPAPTSASMTVKTFIPERVSASFQHKPSTVSRVSALSASLATSKFHHPAYQPESSASSSTSSPSPQSIAQSLSSTLVNPNNRGNGSNVLQFNRVVDDNINTQASYRFFVIEDQMKQHERKREGEMKDEHGEVEKTQTPKEGSTSKGSKIRLNKKKDSAKVEESQSPSNKDSDAGDAGDAASSRGRDKGKRKVTFDDKPAVVDANEAEDEQADESDEDDAMIFSLDDLDEDDDAPKDTRPKQTLPLLEAPPSRPLRDRRINSGIETFNALRPSSLPAPSHMRPIRSTPGVDASSRLVLKKPVKRVSRESAASSLVPTPVSENDAAILKLVAADTPSHRGAWKPESKAWRTFTRRRETEDSDEEQDVIPEEGDDEATTARPTNIMGSKRSFTTYQMTSPVEGIPQSLPVAIRMHHVAKQPLSLASYRAPGIEPPSASAAQEASDGPSSPDGSSKKAPNSTAIRKAMYAERDRSRAMDPGFLDFTSEKDEDEEDEDQEDESTKSDDAGEKARKHALKILQARSEIPTESMWRSLA